MKVWNYIELHHERFGAALFVIPACAAGLAVFELITAVAWLLD